MTLSAFYDYYFAGGIYCMTGYILFALYVLFSSSGLVLIKMGTTNAAFSTANGILNLVVDIKLIIGMICYMVSFLLYIMVLSKFNLSTIFPVASGIVLIGTVLAGVFFFKEQLAIHHIIGVAMILIGIFLLNIKN